MWAAIRISPVLTSTTTAVNRPWASNLGEKLSDPEEASGEEPFNPVSPDYFFAGAGADGGTGGAETGGDVAVTGAGAGGGGNKIFTAASLRKSSSNSRVASP